MALKRLSLLVVLALSAAIVLVPGANAGNFDEEKMGCAGENPATCPTGTEGVPYSLTIYLAPPDGGRGEDFGCATFHHTAGTFPPGLSISDEGYISGTPTQAGTYDFYLTVKYDKEASCPFKNPSDDRFVINVNPGIPKLTIGPESAPVGTVSTPYSLQMTATVSDPKTWSIASGQLPPGPTIDPSSGLISGTPTTPGDYVFTVLAAMPAPDTRSDTKSLAVAIRPQLALTRATVPLASEVGVRFLYPFAASGGTQQYTWALTAGALPTGVVLEPTGALAGVPEEPGRFPFAVSVTDTEGRVATLSAQLRVANRLEIVVTRLRDGKVGRYYRAKLRAVGGVKPAIWRIKRGPLPRGVQFDRDLGLFVGIPKRAKTYRIGVEIRDALRVKATDTVVLVVKPAKKSKKPKKN